MNDDLFTRMENDQLPPSIMRQYCEWRYLQERSQVKDALHSTWDEVKSKTAAEWIDYVGKLKTDLTTDDKLAEARRIINTLPRR